MSDENFKSDAEACIEAGRTLGSNSVKIENINGVPAIVRKDGFNVQLMPELLAHPTRAKGIWIAHDLDSFNNWFKKFKNEDSIIIVDTDPAGNRPTKFLALINYHGVEEAGHCDFGVTYEAEPSVEWKRWASKNKVAMNHADFLEHIEDTMDLIIEPEGAALLKLIGDLRGTSSARFQNALNLHNGSTKLVYEEDVTIRGSETAGSKNSEIEFPTEIVTQLPPFLYGPSYKVKSKLRYRIANKQLMLAYEMVDVHKIIQDAVKDQVAKITEATSAPVFYGKR